MEGSQPTDIFERHLRWALQHLYDPAELRQSPLGELLGLNVQQSPMSLQQLLLEAIEGLRPRENIPPQARAWRTYRALYHRYAEQFAQREVAKALGLSIRTLRREERLALRVLADRLWVRYDLQSQAERLAALAPPPGEEDIASPRAPTHEQELAWLRSVPSQPVALGDAVVAALRVATPLLDALRVQAICDLPDELPFVRAQSDGLHQALLNALTAAVRTVPGGKVCIAAQVADCQIRLVITPQPVAPGPALSPEALDNLQMVRQLLALSGGTVEVEQPGPPGCPFLLCMDLAVAKAIPVLVIDDNADTTQLLERYLAGTRYAFVGTRDPQAALALAIEARPQAIVLDVMLPGVDGWELLGRLRANPATHHIPVIVCTILPEEPLALALGAAAFCRKPVSRADLLGVLDALTHPPQPGSGA